MIKTGYTFGGWYGDESFTQTVTFPVTGVTGAKEFWAKWILNDYAVTWHADGGTPTPTQSGVDHGGSIAVPEMMTKTGHTFDGWYGDSGLTQAVTFPVTDVAGAKEFWAKWTADNYSVTWHTDGGSPAPAQTGVDHGGSIAAPAAMTKTGYAFDGWYGDKGLTQKVTFPVTNVTGAKEFWVKWTMLPPETYKYVNNDIPGITITVENMPFGVMLLIIDPENQANKEVFDRFQGKVSDMYEGKKIYVLYDIILVRYNDDGSVMLDEDGNPVIYVPDGDLELKLTIEGDILKNLNNVVVLHEVEIDGDLEVIECLYAINEGKITFTATSFSPYGFIADDPDYVPLKPEPSLTNIPDNNPHTGVAALGLATSIAAGGAAGLALLGKRKKKR
jgi:uncharacterized repeat protein (TIGR02543 family)